MKKLLSVVVVLVLASLASAQGTYLTDSQVAVHCYGDYGDGNASWVAWKDTICLTRVNGGGGVGVKIERPIPAEYYVSVAIWVKQSPPATNTDWVEGYSSFSDSFNLLRDLIGVTSRDQNGMGYFNSGVSAIRISWFVSDNMPLQPGFQGFVMAPCSLKVTWYLSSKWGGIFINGQTKFPVTIIPQWPPVSVDRGVQKLVPYVPKRQRVFYDILGRKVPGFVCPGVYVSKGTQLIEWGK